MNSNRKNILFVSHTSDFIGGAEYDFFWLLEYYSALKEKYMIFALCPPNDLNSKYASMVDLLGTYKWGYLPIRISPILVYIKYILKFPLQYFQIRSFVKKNKIDLCVLNVSVLLWPAIAIKSKNITSLVFIRETIEPRTIRKFAYKILSKCCKYIISVSEQNISKVKEFNINLPYSIIYSSSKIKDNILLSDLSEKSLLKELIDKKKTGAKIFLNIGPIYNLKNQILILDAISKIKQDEEKIVVVFIGSYDEESSYYKIFRNKISEYNLSNQVFIIGETSHQDIFAYYKIAYGLIISSKSEGLPLIISEAFYFKVPLISTKVGGIPEIITSMENGILVDFNEKDLASAMLKLMSDHELYNKLSANAYQTYLDKFDLDKSLKKTEEIFNFVMNES